MSKQKWMIEAEKWIGQKEVPGPGFNPWIKKMWFELAGGKWLWDQVGKGDDSKLPWCGAFVAMCMKSAGHALPKNYYRAKEWLNWGVPISRPVVGSVVIFSRTGGGHVGFVVGVDKSGNILVLGGNQGDEVNIRAFPPSRVTGYRYPANETMPGGALPVFAQAKVSDRES